MAEPVDLDLEGFQPQVVEKVMRLLTVLDAINADPILATAMCLHGGTALNLFLLGAPRLSVDIDLNYIGSTDVGTLRAIRPGLERRLVDLGENLGFSITIGKPEHSGRSFRLGYQGSFGPDHVKIDLDYLNRSPLLRVGPKSVRLKTGAVVSFPLNSDIELVSGKMKALVERVAVRDLYDVNQIAKLIPGLMASGDVRLFRRVILYYLSLSAPFPRLLRVADRFRDRRQEVTDQLYPLLPSDDRPTLDDMIGTAESYLADVSGSADDDEAQYIERAARADFAPELLFANYPETLAATQVDPAAQWKMLNLAKTIDRDVTWAPAQASQETWM